MVFTAVGLAALLIEHGFYTLPAGLSLGVLWAVQAVAAAGMAADRVARFFLAPERAPWLRRHWVETAMPVAALIAAGVATTPMATALVAAKIYILGNLLIRGVQLYAKAVGSGIHPARLLGASFLFCILIGSGLLLLPRAVPEGEKALYPPDALFTATSATCVTGLIVRDTGTEFSRFGQVVILCMIQLGGLGLMTFGTIFVLLGGHGLGLRHTAVVGQALNEEPLGRIGRMVKFVVLCTLGAELFGALLLRGLWPDHSDGMFRAVFHSISAFCNAGFSLQADSFISMRDGWRVLLALPMLIIVGGIGFPVLMDVLGGLPAMARYTFRSQRRTIGVPRPRWSLHTKIVLSTTVLLLVFGTAGLVLVEQPTRADRVGKAHHLSADEGADRLNDWRVMPTVQRVRQGWFQAVSARTAGFNTIDLDHLTPAGKLWMIGLMAVGGSPASTAGGVKTVTLAILVLLVWTALRGRENVEVYGRTLPVGLMRRAVALAILFGALLGAATLALAICQGPQSKFIDVFFEAVSACATVGLSLGETARLTTAGKFVLIVGMFIGRVGPLTLLMSLTTGAPSARYRYPSENLVVG